MNPLGDEAFAMIEKRWMGARWTMWVCAEPDGEHCSSGTNRKLIAHHCAAARGLHPVASESTHVPRLVSIVVVAE
jgi:hypothetical protein